MRAGGTRRLALFRKTPFAEILGGDFAYKGTRRRRGVQAHGALAQ